MGPFGVQLTLLVGPTVPVPAPLPLTENIDKIEINQSDEGRSGFQIVFSRGALRSGRRVRLPDSREPVAAARQSRGDHGHRQCDAAGADGRFDRASPVEPGNAPGAGTFTSAAMT